MVDWAINFGTSSEFYRKVYDFNEKILIEKIDFIKEITVENIAMSSIDTF